MFKISWFISSLFVTFADLEDLDGIVTVHEQDSIDYGLTHNAVFVPKAIEEAYEQRKALLSFGAELEASFFEEDIKFLKKCLENNDLFVFESLNKHKEEHPKKRSNFYGERSYIAKTKDVEEYEKYCKIFYNAYKEHCLI